jgi:DNA (cytosine-5)-methyltransferase 1
VVLAYYNENDRFAANWLRVLIANGHIAPGDVDERSIEDVPPDDLRPYTQCHFFAGIGGWSYALRLAGWPDDRPVWTGSCPCQPYSAAGARGGDDDPRNLWWAFRWLIDQRRPTTVFGEQVASKDGRRWFSGVRLDLETLGYGVRGADLCAAGASAPDIRQRLFWMANANGGQSRQAGTIQPGRQHGQFAANGGVADRMGDAACRGRVKGRLDIAGDYAANGEGSNDRVRYASPPSRMGDANGAGHALGTRITGNDGTPIGATGRQAAVEASPWSDYIVLQCKDGNRRASAEPGAFPLAYGVPARVGRLRGYGNAIVPQVAARFIEACLG